MSAVPPQKRQKTVEEQFDDLKERARAQHGIAVSGLARAFEGYIQLQDQEIKRLTALCDLHNITHSIEIPANAAPNRAARRQEAKKQAKTEKKQINTSLKK